MMKTALNKPIRYEKGQALILALILLAVGGLLIAPLLGYMGTGLMAGQVFEKKMDELYAADAGIEFGIWKLKNDLPASFPAEYPNQFNMNGKNVSVTIEDKLFQTYKIISTAGSTRTESFVRLLQDYVIVSTGEGKVELKKHATINGDVYSVGKVKIKDATVNGTITDYGDPIDLGIDPEDYKEAALLGGTYTGDCPFEIKSDQNLGPLYIPCALKIEKDVHVTLTGTVYVEEHAEIEDDVLITGSGNLVAANEENEEGEVSKEAIKIKKRVTIAPDDPDNLPLIMGVSGDKIKVDEGCNITAIIYAKFGKVEIKGKTQQTLIDGALIGTHVKVDNKNAIITYDENLSDWESLGQPTPIDYVITSTGEGKAELKKHAQIYGNVYSVGKVKIKDATVYGTITDYGDPVDFGIDPEDYKAEAQAGGEHTGNLEINSDRELGPLYIKASGTEPGNLKIKKGKHVTLTGTVYVEGKIEIEDEVLITGTGNLVAANEEDEKDAIKIKKEVTIVPDEPQNVFLIMAVSGDKVKVEEKCDITAVIYSKFGRVEIKGKNQTTVHGALLGATVKVDNEDAIITYNEYLNDWENFGLQILTYEINPPQ